MALDMATVPDVGQQHEITLLVRDGLSATRTNHNVNPTRIIKRAGFGKVDGRATFLRMYVC